MNEPTIQEKSGDMVLVSTYWLIFDKQNGMNRFCTPLVRLSNAEYYSKDHSGYYAREQRFRDLYNGWLERHLTQRALDGAKAAKK